MADKLPNKHHLLTLSTQTMQQSNRPE